MTSAQRQQWAQDPGVILPTCNELIKDRGAVLVVSVLAQCHAQILCPLVALGRYHAQVLCHYWRLADVWAI